MIDIPIRFKPSKSNLKQVVQWYCYHTNDIKSVLWLLFNNDHKINRN